MTHTDKVIKLLLRARKHIARPSMWCSHTMARDAAGVQVAVESPRAVTFCALGALQKAALETDTPYFGTVYETAWGVLTKRAIALYGVGQIANLNDRLGHRAVLTLYGSAIWLLRRRRAARNRRGNG